MRNDSRSSFEKDKRHRVLIVDDDKDFVSILAHTLKSHGYEIEIASNTEDVWKKIVDLDAQVVLIDIRLGCENGIELMVKIKQAYPEILCIMMTACATINTAIEALQQGAYDYLRKPLNIKDLLVKLNRCFEKLHLEETKAAAEADLKRTHRIQSVLIDIFSIFQKQYSLEKMLDHIIASIPWRTLQSQGYIILVRNKSNELIMKLSRGVNPKLADGLVGISARKGTSFKVYFPCICTKDETLQKEIELINEVDCETENILDEKYNIRTVVERF